MVLMMAGVDVNRTMFGCRRCIRCGHDVAHHSVDRPYHSLDRDRPDCGWMGCGCPGFRAGEL